MFVLGILGVIFTIYNYFKNPQIDGDKKDALLAQQVQWAKEGSDTRFKEIQESTERRFAEMQLSIKDAFALGQNHIHTVDTKVDALSNNLISMGKEITRLATIIEERIPKK